MEINKDNLHHAYILVGDWEEATLAILRTLDVPKENNPDLFIYETLGIEEARHIKMRSQSSAFGSKKIFIVNAEGATLPAQNALLKTLEEPVANTHFFLVVAYASLLLPTLRSRAEIHLLDTTRDEISSKKFLSLPVDKRITFASKFADSEEPLGPFIDGVLHELIDRKATEDTLKKVFTVRRFADDGAAQPRLILEHLAFIVG